MTYSMHSEFTLLHANTGHPGTGCEPDTIMQQLNTTRKTLKLTTQNYTVCLPVVIIYGGAFGLWQH